MLRVTTPNPTPRSVLTLIALAHKRVSDLHMLYIYTATSVLNVPSIHQACELYTVNFFYYHRGLYNGNVGTSTSARGLDC